MAEHPKAEVYSVCDLLPGAAADLAGRHGAIALSNPESALADPAVDAVVITTPASSHAELVVAAARAGKAIFCEKPLAEDIPTARAAVEEVRKAGVPSFMGFMKRFEPSHLALIQAVQAGEIGDVELVLLTNRDPKVTLLDLSRQTHHKAPYTLLRESTVHDFDMARALLDDEPVEVYVAASSLVEPELGRLGEVDTAMTTLKTARGALCHINNIWRTTYGYDQRLEVHGAKGMLRAENRPETSLVRYTDRRRAARQAVLGSTRRIAVLLPQVCRSLSGRDEPFRRVAGGGQAAHDQCGRRLPFTAAGRGRSGIIEDKPPRAGG